MASNLSPNRAPEQAVDEPELSPEAQARWDAELARINDRRRAEAEQDASRSRARRWFWLSHHWPEHYAERCFKVGRLHLCRRCSALYPLGFLVATAAALGWPIWPEQWDPVAIWILCLPPTTAFVGEMLGWFRYSGRWQVGTTLLAGLAFGKALGYELVSRWSSEFWGPIAVFGGIWFFASYAGHRRRFREAESAAG